MFRENFLALSDLNKEVEQFPYSYMYVDIRDKPTIIASSALSSSDHSIKQKGICILFLCVCMCMCICEQ